MPQGEGTYGSQVGRPPKKAEGGEMEDQMNALAISVAPATIEEEQLPDEEMEEDYVDFVVSSTLDEEDKNYLESALAEDAKLSELFDQVVESASEFSGSGPVEGLGSEVSDSIPARLSDGEFVFTAKATDEIGADNLQRMMEDAEAGADGRQGVVHGGVIDEEAFYNALKDGNLGSAALDVFEVEPAIGNKLSNLPNFIATPHIGAQTKEAQSLAANVIAEKIIQVLRGVI